MLPPSDQRSSPLQGSYEGSSSLRRLRESPYDALQRISEAFGHRFPTSLNEARAAALLDGRLRRSGLQVVADPFNALCPPGWPGIALGGLCLITMLTYYWWPWWALGCIALLVVLAGWSYSHPPFLMGAQKPSQNIVGTQAASGTRNYRLVLLARLDTSWYPDRVAQVFGGEAIPTIRLFAIVILTLFGLVGIFDPQRIWLYLMILPACYILATSMLDVLALRPFWPAAPHDSANLATLLTASERIGELEHIEVWVVGLGATRVHAGLADFLRRYPFDHTTTLFVVVEALGNGAPALVEAEGWFSVSTADPMLLAAANERAMVDESAARCIRRKNTTLMQPLSRQQYRALSIACLGPHNQARHALQPQHLEQATNLIVGLAHDINLWEPIPTNIVKDSHAP
jgi:hypothetical protein